MAPREPPREGVSDPPGPDVSCDVETYAPALALLTTRPAPVRSAPPSEPDPAEAPIRAALDRRDVRGAFDLLMDRYGDRIHHYCVRMVGAERAAEAHQRVFVDSYRGLPSFDRRSSLATWLFSIARRRCIDIGRELSKRRERETDDEHAVEAVADTRPTPFERLDESQRLAALADCIDGLAPATREAVVLRYQEGLAYEELAELSGESANTIGRRVARAVVVLRTCVEGRLGEDR